ncbi:urease accessory protein [Hymenobacter cheonanensis]|uniref:urease accessory protein n=1 Tax=Hymenobacter sp. CA2-7 TaxID=3063993 RepID=UPI002713EA85|nr:urease accessory protein [Hymenobacter sp. CA2-7]MDO7886565.1 urease accessory protein [Hymenobacter sp. CA2-7]
MQPLVPILFAAVVGMGHAFEPDHLLAVSTLVTRHDRLGPALRDGLFWGLGHTTMLVLFGSVIIFSRATWLHPGYFEVAVGVMLIGLGISRLLDKNSYQSFQLPKQRVGFAYTVGLVHGLAGSGALVLAVLSAIAQPAWAVAYILLFGLGSVLGMLVAVSLMRVPFTLRMRLGRQLRAAAVVLSSALSVGYGGWLVWVNV